MKIMKMLKSIFLIGALMAGALFGGASNAIPAYGALGGAGVYFGTGNSNENWTIDKGEFGTEVGLRVKDRSTLQVVDGSSGIYHIPLGTYAGGGVKQYLSYEFSVSTGLLKGLVLQLGIDHDPSAGVNYTWVNPQTYWSDNAVAPSPYKGFQNSENVGFGDTPGGAFDPTQAGLYSFTLREMSGDIAVVTTTMLVQVGDPVIDVPPGNSVPEPTMPALMFIGVLSAGLALRKAKAKARAVHARTRA